MLYEKCEGGYKAYYVNGAFMGELLVCDDGYYHWWPNEERRGYITAEILHTIADKLDNLNAKWNDMVKELGNDNE